MSEWVRQTKSIEREYDDDGNYLEVTTDTEYANPVHMQATRMKQTGSDQDTTITYMKYPLDYTPVVSGGILKLQDNHFITPVIEKVVSKKTASGTESILNGVIQTYSSSTSLPDFIYLFEPSSPVSSGNFSFSNAGSGFSKDPGYSQRINFSKYDAKGNLQEQQKDNDVVMSYLWGHNYTLPIAQITNASVASVYHTSFEEDGVVFVGGSGKNLAHTGLKVLNGGSFTIPATFTPPSTNGLVMSYWYWNGSEWKSSGELPYSNTIASAGSKLDEIRIYPKGAQMITYAYDPGVGVISVTDGGNVTAYYEYDKFARLRSIRDNRGKLVKTFRYHYKGQP
jgi:YD repeat-containing protein